MGQTRKYWREPLRSLVPLLAVVATGLMAAACGGSGSSVDSGPIAATNNAQNAAATGANHGDLGVFVTDRAGSSYDHVWVSIKKIDLKLAAGGTRTIFEDPQGLGIDLASLRDDSGPRYQFVNQLDLPTGTYIAAQITLSKNAVVFPTNTTTGKALPFAGQAKDAKEAVLSLQFEPPKLLGTGHDDLVLDFDLSKWKEDNGQLVATVASSMGAGLESADRNSPAIERGTIESLKGDVPEQTFTLKNAKASEVQVKTSATTSLFGGSATPIVLTKGQTVEVTGAFDTNTRRFDALSIKVIDPKAPEVQVMRGVVGSIDPKASTWTITPNSTRGFLPEGQAVTVGVSADAKFYGMSGLAIDKDEFFKGLSSSKSVSVLAEGSFDATKGLLTASEARLVGDVSQPAVKVGGVVSDPKSDAQTFGLTVDSYEGMLTKPGAGAIVAITPTTSFVDENGKALSSEQFYAALANPKSAQVYGVLDASSGHVLASSVKLAAAPAPVPPKKTQSAKRKA